MKKETKSQKRWYYSRFIISCFVLFFPLVTFAFQGGPPPPNGGFVEDVPPEVSIGHIVWFLIAILFSFYLFCKINSLTLRKRK